MKKIWIFMIAIALIAGTQSVMAVSDEDFAEQSSYYKSLCSNSYKENKDVCEQYKTWLYNQNQNSLNDMQNLKNQLEANQANINEKMKLVNQYHQEAEEAQREIEALSNNIIQKEAEITALEGEIIVKEDSIKEREETVKSYIANRQQSMRVNDYIEFIMGAQNFSEMMRRTEVLNSIKTYNEEIIAQLHVERQELKVMQEDLIIVKGQLEDERNMQAQKKEYALTQKEVIALLVDQIRAENQGITETMEVIDKKTAENEELIRSIGDSIVPSSGFSRPVDGRFEITATVWYYPWGSAHFGTDFASSVGTPLLSPGNGIVTATRGGCPTWGGYPGDCNGGWGNYVTLIINVEGNIYGVLMAHMQLNTFNVSPMDVVSAGTVVGRMGSSGSSTGPHMHLEIYYLGSDSIQAAYNRWDGSVSFGTGGTSWGNGWAKRCVANGNTAPCRMDPLSVYPYQMYGSY